MPVYQEVMILFFLQMFYAIFQFCAYVKFESFGWKHSYCPSVSEHFFNIVSYLLCLIAICGGNDSFNILGRM